ncbi:Smr/MutS family protein [Paraburkholderia rhizosphaerae]|uniref:DNA-nicking Smr family endonuclease n=1 Tax=Paraburkholderia rhizosphaerae TaxID=480658 RepID=A0A4R8LIM2_9BURK|nr:Smr/MutS family protein [Paraburkholderia rhizosphaerae]TDY43277.1 DNA-nicking Smr family endonuclease [Paraburkholderia rhizosphaerae]
MPKNRPHPSDPKPKANARVSAPAPVEADRPRPIEPTLTRGAGLADLRTLRDALKGDAQRREQETARAKKAKRAADADAEQFRRELGEVTPLGTKPRASLSRTPPVPLPLQTRLDEAAVLNEAISDEFDPEMLLDTDESLFYHRPGINQEVVRKLRRGAWIVQAQLDLHGMRRDEARDALAEFIRDSSKRGLRCLRVIHGKGLGSIGKEPVLKGKVRAWLVQKEEVIAFCQARPHDGGAGAVLVLLQPGATPPQPKN